MLLFAARDYSNNRRRGSRCHGRGEGAVPSARVSWAPSILCRSSCEKSAREERSQLLRERLGVLVVGSSTRFFFVFFFLLLCCLVLDAAGLPGRPGRRCVVRRAPLGYCEGEVSRLVVVVVVVRKRPRRCRRCGRERRLGRRDLVSAGARGRCRGAPRS